MHVLTVVSHPNDASLTHAIANRFMEGAREAGHTTELADLHAEGFDPRWSTPDFAQFEDLPMPQDVLNEQARIERCNALCMVFPLYWYSMPAMMKGWLDRVWSWNWAYNQIGDLDTSLQPPRTGILLIPAAANPDNWEDHNFENVMDTIWRTGTLGFMGITDKRLHFLNGSEGSEDRRKRLLEKAYQAGLDVGNPEARQG